MVNFIHDEYIFELPDDELLTARAKHIEAIMVTAMRLLTPDVKVGAEAAAMYKWDKKAKTVYDKNNKLVPWVPDNKGK